MAKQSSVKFESRGLQILQETLKKLDDGGYHVQVGIFGEKTSRKKGGMTNAEIGFVHEMGSVSRKIPRRSFLWDTLSERGKIIMDKLKGPSLELFKAGQIQQYLERVGLACTNEVDQAFATAGFGKWAPLSYRTMMAKTKGKVLKRRQKLADTVQEAINNIAILIRTAQLRRAISFRIVKGGVS